MARLFPFRSETPSQDGAPRVVDLEGEDADAVFSALSSTTARRIYSRLDEEPGTPSDVADAIDSSIQNVRYHLENLEDAGLVEVVDTWYSSRGNEMSVYATTDGPLIVTSDESTGSQLKTAISRLIGGIGALAGGSLLVQYGLTRWLTAAEFGAVTGPSQTGEGDAGDAAPPAATERDEPTDGGSAEESAEDVVDEPADDDAGIQTVEDEADTDAADADADVPESEADEPEADADAPADETVDEGLDAPTDESVETVPDDVDADPVADYAADGSAEAADAIVSTVPPGLLFFLGGLVVLLAVTAYWYWYRPSY